MDPDDTERIIDDILNRLENRGIGAIYAHESRMIENFARTHPGHLLTKRWEAFLQSRDVVGKKDLKRARV